MRWNARPLPVPTVCIPVWILAVEMGTVEATCIRLGLTATQTVVDDHFGVSTTETGRSRTVGMSDRVKDELKELTRSQSSRVVFSSVDTTQSLRSILRPREAYATSAWSAE